MDFPEQIDERGHLCVTGTGRAGVELLARLFEALGHPGLQRQGEYFERTPAGWCKRRLLAPTGGELLAAAQALPPATGLVEESEQENFELAVLFQEQLHSLVRCDVPFVLIEFARLAKDPAYGWSRLEPFLPGCAPEEFAAALDRLFDPAEVRACRGEYAVLSRSDPQVRQRLDRRRRRHLVIQRATAGLLLLVALVVGGFCLRRETPPRAVASPTSMLVQDDEDTVTDPESLPEERSSASR